MRCGTSPIGTSEPSANGKASGNAASRSATHAAWFISSATPAPRPARIGKVTTTPPPHGSMRKLTRRARRLRRHSTRVGPLGNVSTSDRGSSILLTKGRSRRFVNSIASSVRRDAAPKLRRLRQLHAARIERGEQLSPAVRRSASDAADACCATLHRRCGAPSVPSMRGSAAGADTMARRVALSVSCACAPRSLFQLAYTCAAIGEFTLAAAVMQPALPSSNNGRSSVSSPAYTSKPSLREILHIGAAVVVVAAAVLHALHRAGKCLQQTADQLDAERHRRLLRELVEIVLDIGADAIDHLEKYANSPSSVGFL